MGTVLLKNLVLIDGTGEERREGTILIKDEVIERIEEKDFIMEVDEVIDLGGLVVAPGFIDIHSHADAYLFVNPLAEAKLRQGVTSEVSGNCGFGAFPVPTNPEKLKLFTELMTSLDFQFPEKGITWNDLSSFRERLKNEQLGTNILPLVAHGALRVSVMGSKQEKPTDQEMKEMISLLKENLEQGAWGFSTGLAYAPGSFAEFEEILELAKEVKRQDSFYTSHIRNEGDDVLQAIDEIIEIGRLSHCRINISHLKAMGVKNWYQADKLLNKIKDAKAEGIEVSADQYPYPASSTILGILVPKWANDGGAAKMCQRLQSEELRCSILAEIEANMEARGGADRIIIANCAKKYPIPIEGRTIREIANQFGLSPVETIAKLIIDNTNAVMAIYLSIADEDVEKILKDETIMVGSDGMINIVNPQYSHPRAFGTFPRILGHYVREKKTLSLERAIKKMTSLPAEKIGLKNRGLIKEGFIADLVIFDSETIIDKSTYINASQYPVGIESVMMSGKWIIKNGKLTGIKVGEILIKGK